MPALPAKPQNETISLDHAKSHGPRLSTLVRRESLPWVVWGMCGLATPEIKEAWADQLEDCLERVILHYGSGRHDMELVYGYQESGSFRRLTISAMPISRDGDVFTPEPNQTRQLADTGWVPTDDVGSWALLVESIFVTAISQFVPREEVRCLAERGRRDMMATAEENPAPNRKRNG